MIGFFKSFEEHIDSIFGIFPFFFIKINKNIIKSFLYLFFKFICFIFLHLF